MPQTDFRHPRYYINRELSWLEFNARVLAEARDASNPLLERLKFLSIFAGNLDEYFMIRLANLRELEVAGIDDTRADGLTPPEQLEAIGRRVHELVAAHSDCLHDEVLPGLEGHGLVLHRCRALPEADRAALTDRFHREVFPVLTPMTVDPSHPFPHLPNLSLNLVVTFAPLHSDALEGGTFQENLEAREDGEEGLPYAIMEIPRVLEPLLVVNSHRSGIDHVLLTDLVRSHVHELFKGLHIAGAWLFRVTRNSDLSLEEQDVENLMKDLERELRSRTFRRVVRLEVEGDMPDDVVALLQHGLEVPDRETYRIRGLMHIPRLMAFYGLDRYRYLRDPPFNPRLSPQLASSSSIFSILRDQDILLHHPYESFSTVAELLQHAAHDPKVLAIKLTLYRTSGDSVIIQALKDAAENGKQVTAVVELKARFDEKNNIVWARQLERAGCHVVYGIVGLKTHCKAVLVVRREGDTVRRYVHLSTGNYNSATARLYTDVALLTQDPALGEDVSQLFNILTGYNARVIRDIIDGRRPAPAFHKMAVSPFNLMSRVLQLIEDEIRMHRPDRPGLIRAKFNSLVDPTLIDALYRASSHGVRIELAVRGICCLRPGLPGVSETIRVVSVVDRFLEHSRVFHFQHGGADLVYLSSADWMPRNLYRRIEVLFPVESATLRDRLLREVLDETLQDNVKAWTLGADGTYIRVPRGEDEPRRRSQKRLIDLAREAGLKSLPYDTALREASAHNEHGRLRPTRPAPARP
jgi:polyphosphate kinase